MEIVLLRGLGRDKRHWCSFEETLSGVLPKANIHCLDSPGNGEFSHVKSPLSIGKYAEHCRALLEDKTREPVHIIALSMGGMIALEWSKQAPEEVASLCLINSSVANLTAVQNRINIKTLTQLALQLLLSNDIESAEKKIIQSVSSNWLKHRHILNDWVRFHAQNPTKVSNLLRQLLAASRFKLTHHVTAPCIVINSKNDNLVSPIASQNLSKYLDCPLYTHPSAGHDLPMDAPLWLAEQIISFVTKLSSNC